MKSFLQYSPFLLVFVGAAIFAYFQGTAKERWSFESSEELKAYTQRLTDIPEEIGDWKSETLEIDARAIKSSGVDGYLYRIYSNEKTGQSVQIFVASGKAKHIALHTPDFCYRGAGYKQRGQFSTIPLEETLSTEKNPSKDLPEMLTVRFVKSEGNFKQNLQIYWAYSSEGKWEAVSNPRTYYNQTPAMYKVYIQMLVTQNADKNTNDNACTQFAKELFPVLDASLFPERTTITVADDTKNGTER
ncbi:MAG: EpsI family protein [Pirellulaceae bacterium]|nr:EpsI family protein [Pirellulaceae bacterium]